MSELKEKVTRNTRLLFRVLASNFCDSEAIAILATIDPMLGSRMSFVAELQLPSVHVREREIRN